MFIIIIYQLEHTPESYEFKIFIWFEQNVGALSTKSIRFKPPTRMLRSESNYPKWPLRRVKGNPTVKQMCTPPSPYPPTSGQSLSVQMGGRAIKFKFHEIFTWGPDPKSFLLNGKDIKDATVPFYLVALL
jgi:hypothetical protein